MFNKKYHESRVVQLRRTTDETVSPRNDTATKRSKIPIQYYSNAIRTITIILYSYERGRRQNTVTCHSFRFRSGLGDRTVFSRRSRVSPTCFINHNVFSCTALDGATIRENPTISPLSAGRATTPTAMTDARSEKNHHYDVFAASRGQKYEMRIISRRRI